MAISFTMLLLLSRIRVPQSSFGAIVLVISLTRPCLTISNSNGSTLLTRLSSISDIKSRQRAYPQDSYYHPAPNNLLPGQYPVGIPYPHPNGWYPNPNVPDPYGYGPSSYPYPPGSPGPLSPVNALGSIRDSFVRALESVAFNDELRCVPKLLCEVLAGNAASLKGRQNLLPFNLDMGSLLGMLSQLNLDQASPLLMFGRAVLLGSQRDPNSCSYAYPHCPRDPDSLVQYLNNYNGGFFRNFNGLPGQIPQNYPPPYKPQYYNHPNNPIYNTYANQYAQQRILSATNYNQYVAPSYKSIKFPENNQDYINNYNAYSGVKVPLVFPGSDLGYRKGRKLFPEPVRYERPLPNHMASPLILPVRTGTGELILDTNSFFPEGNQYYDRQRNDNDIIISNKLY